MAGASTEDLPEEARSLLADLKGGPILWLTGAGISAASGIPTFRGEEGYWRVGSRNYHAEELATFSAYRQMPEEVWSWYLYRRAVCRAAAPNAAHRALASLEARLRERFVLVTQNVDGLHLRAGNTLERTYQIHGNIDFMRCVSECSSPEPIPERLGVEWGREQRFGERERALLVCSACGAPSRPHVLWFDESYDEPNFRFESSLRAAMECALLVVVGTTGATNLPMQVGELVTRRGAPMIVINPEPNPFSEMVASRGLGCFLEGKAGTWVPPLAAALAVA